jgi:hypothetical protein
VPRKQFCGGRAGSDFSEMSKKYDQEFMDDYLKTKFAKTNDGKNSLPNEQETYKVGRSYDYQSCLMFMDTQMEKDIGLGPKYQYPPMNEGECVVNEQMALNLNI